jgi:single-stranded DNA-specific DHH superfamily exonuclease
MEIQDLIPIPKLCIHYNVPVSFINTLEEYQLVELVAKNNNLYIQTKQISKVEKLIRMHYDLHINIEGIDVIYNLLKQNESLKEEITTLNNRLQLYEDF